MCRRGSMHVWGVNCEPVNSARLMKGRMGQREMRAKWAYMMALTGHNR